MLKNISQKLFLLCIILGLTLSGLPSGIPFAFAANTKIRQEINIIDGYLGSASGVYATSSAIVQIDTTKYTGATYYFEVVASTTSAVSSNIYLKNATTFATVATISNFSNSNTYTRYRSSSFTPTTGANDYVVVIGNEAVQKGAVVARVVILQDSATISSTQTQIEIGNKETYTTTSTSTFAAPKYWYYDSTKWEGSPSFYAEVTYARTIDISSTVASSTTYSTAGTYTVVTPTGTASTSIQLWGGGGGGGAASTNTSGSGSGGAGGTYAKKTIVGLSGSKTLVIGAAGIGGVSTVNGGQGATSTWDTNIVVAGGGMGGLINSGVGGTGLTTGSTGDIVSAGGNGAAGTSGGISGGGGEGGSMGGAGGNATTGTGGSGGGSGEGGNGANGSTGNGTGASGTAPGGGGAGGRSTGSPNADGGNGGLGQAIITNDITTSANATTTITLQEDDGSFGSWTDKKVIVSNGTASTPTRVRSSFFTPTTGRHYRIVFKSGYNGATFAIYNAKIIVNQSGDATAGLGGWWKFDEGSGSATDSSVGGHTGTLFGNTAYTPGQIGAYAMTFDGADDYIVTSGTSPASAASALTVSAWVYVNDNTVSQMIMEDGTTYQGNAFYFYLNLGRPEFEVYTVASGFDAIQAVSAIPQATWTHITGTWAKNERVKLYVNGESTGVLMGGSASQPNDLQTSDTALYIGGRPASPLDLDFSGKIDDARVYTRQLTDSEVAAVYNQTASESITKLEPQYLVVNTLANTGTSLQKFLTYWDPAEWTTGNSYTFIHEANSVSGGTSVAKLTDSSGSPDVTGSTISSITERKRSTMTMPAAAAALDFIATTNNNNIFSSRILVQVEIAAAQESSVVRTLKKFIGGAKFKIFGGKAVFK